MECRIVEEGVEPSREDVHDGGPLRSGQPIEGGNERGHGIVRKHREIWRVESRASAWRYEPRLQDAFEVPLRDECGRCREIQPTRPTTPRTTRPWTNQRVRRTRTSPVRASRAAATYAIAVKT